jgi:alpha-1,2-mannosyltransferase
LRGCFFVWPRILLFPLAAAIVAGGFYFAGQSGSSEQVYSNDFNVFYHAAREVIAGRDPYQHSLGEWTPYLYPPLLAELLIPLALLPLPVAAYIWFLISATSIVAALWMATGLAVRQISVQHLLKSSTWRVVLVTGSILVILRFVLDNFNLGQVNPVIVALAVAHIFLYARDRKVLSAFVLVAAVSIKLTPAVLLLYHVAKLRLKFAAACIGLLVVITVLSFAPFGSSATNAFHKFADRTVKNDQGYDFGYAGNQSLRSAVARLTTSAEPADSRVPQDTLTLILAMFMLAGSIIAAIRSRSELAGVSPFFCCVVLLSPLSWKAHYVMLALPVANLLASIPHLTGLRRLLIVTAAIASFALFNLTSPRVIGLAAAEWSDSHSMVFIGGIIVFLASLAFLAGEQRTQNAHFGS